MATEHFKNPTNEDDQNRVFGDRVEDQMLPPIYPPGLIKPAMTINFRFGIGEPVVIDHSGQTGAVVAAAVAFSELSIIYLVDVAGDRAEKWYPQNMLRKTLRAYEKAANTISQENRDKTP